jgi:hypothetical protein
MPKVLEGPLDPRVAPCRILRCHQHDEPPDLEQHASPSEFPGVSPLPRNQPSMPAQQGIRRRDRGDLPQGRTADPVSSGGQSSAIVISQTQSPVSELSTQEPVFFDQVADRLPLPTLEPAGQHAQDHLKGCEGDHEAELISRAQA